MRPPTSKLKVAPYAENICESGLACVLTMVQGNLLELTLSHWLIASQTGLLAGAIVGTTVVAAKLRRPWVVSLVLGVVTTAADAFVHPTTFGIASLSEACITGLGAFALSLAVGVAVRRWSGARPTVPTTLASPSAACGSNSSIGHDARL